LKRYLDAILLFLITSLSEEVDLTSIQSIKSSAEIPFKKSQALQIDGTAPKLQGTAFIDSSLPTLPLESVPKDYHFCI